MDLATADHGQRSKGEKTGARHEKGTLTESPVTTLRVESLHEEELGRAYGW